MKWRDRCRPLIVEVIQDNEGKPENEIKQALRDAYPWGERAYHPYKIWCDEINVQLGKRKQRSKKISNDPDQQKLF